MTTPPAPVTLLIATRNLHKVGEIRAILGDTYRYLTLGDFPHAPQVVEDADSFAGNASQKAVELARWLGRVPHAHLDFQSSTLYVLADDSGLEVDALDGAPGVHSARFAALDRPVDGPAPGNSPDTDNNAKLLGLLKDVPPEKRTARFRCVLALTPVLPERTSSASPVCYADELETQTRLFEGVCEGRIGFGPRGRGGFGYDPLFLPTGFEESFAELGESTKNRLSHRSKALAKLKESLCLEPGAVDGSDGVME
jgi:XTP/dITP diphosphohydrolase